MNIIVIGGLTNGKILIDYFLKKKKVQLKLLITHPLKRSVPRITNLKYLRKEGIKVIHDLNANKYYKTIQNLSPDLIFVIGWSGMIKEKIRKIPRYGIIGFHPADLPKYRGRSVIAWQIEEGVKHSAYSAFFISSKPDAGDILIKQKFIIRHNDYVEDVLNKVDVSLKKMLPKIYKMILNASFPRIKQKLNKGFYRKLRNDSNSIISLEENAIKIYNKVRAVSHPYPCAILKYKGKKIKILKSEIVKKRIKGINSNSVGKILLKEKKYFIAQTKDHPIKLFFN
tara:strand:- start:241 stop:1089 length:849 start_codon:yes stop_codon:yes gene_type:complete